MNNWATTDHYRVDKQANYRAARAVEVRQLSLATTGLVRVGFDRVPVTGTFDLELLPDSTYWADRVRTASRVVQAAEPATVRWSAWGV